MSDKPLLSLVVAVYNGEKFLNAFFDSIKAQHLDSLELVVVNDGSSDSSSTIIAQYASEFPFYKVIDQANQGRIRRLPGHRRRDLSGHVPAPA